MVVKFLLRKWALICCLVARVCRSQLLTLSLQLVYSVLPQVLWWGTSGHLDCRLTACGMKELRKLVIKSNELGPNPQCPRSVTNQIALFYSGDGKESNSLKHTLGRLSSTPLLAVTVRMAEKFIQL